MIYMEIVTIILFILFCINVILVFPYALWRIIRSLDRLVWILGPYGGDYCNSLLNLMNKTSTHTGGVLDKICATNAVLDHSFKDVAGLRKDAGSLLELLFEIKSSRPDTDAETDAIALAMKEDALRTAVVKLDTQMQQALATMEQHSKDALNSYNQGLIEQMKEMERMAHSASLDSRMKDIELALKAVGTIPKLQKSIDTLSMQYGELIKASRGVENVGRQMIVLHQDIRTSVKTIRNCADDMARQQKKNSSHFLSKGLHDSPLWNRIQQYFK